MNAVTENLPHPPLKATPHLSGDIETTYFPSIAKPRDGAVTPRPWNVLVAWLSKVHMAAADKQTLPVWCACTFTGNNRKLANVQHVTALVLDFDQDAPLERVAAAFKGYAGIAHTSFSHSPQKPRARLVLRLSRPVTSEEYPLIWGWGFSHSLKESLIPDETTKDPSRAWFVPAENKGNAPTPLFTSRCWEGDSVDVDSILTQAKETEAKRSQTLSTTVPNNLTIARAVKKVSSAINGKRNKTLYDVSFTLGGHVAAGQLDETEARHAVTLAAFQVGLPPDEIERAVDNGFQAGKQKPLPISGQFKATMTACTNELSAHPDWQGVLGFNEFDGSIYFLKAPPFTDSSYAAAKVGRCPEDADLSMVCMWFERTHNVSPQAVRCLDALRNAALLNRYHPVRDYLDSLKWDCTSRIDTWLESFCSVKPESPEQKTITRAFGRRWLVSAVARIYSPGCKADAMLILEGKQGVKKSTTLKALGGEWFRDTDLDLQNKDTYSLIQGCWIQEFAELESLNRSETGRIKHFLSVTHDTWRAAYDRTSKTVARQVIFAGSVNGGQYLKDRTGNRRFWCVRCDGPCDWKGVQENRDQIWAEAVQAYRDGVQWWLTDSEDALAFEEQSTREQADPWGEKLDSWLLSNRDFFTLADAFSGALAIHDASQQKTTDATRLSSLIQQRGWRYTRIRRDGGERQYGYIKG